MDVLMVLTAMAEGSVSLIVIPHHPIHITPQVITVRRLLITPLTRRQGLSLVPVLVQLPLASALPGSIGCQTAAVGVWQMGGLMCRAVLIPAVIITTLPI